MKRGSNNMRGTKQQTIVMMVVAVGTLTACGGDGGGGSSGATPAATRNSSANTTVAPACSGSNCGALGNTYVGSGVGVWQATSTDRSAGTVPVSIAGLTGQSVTLVYASQSAAAQPMLSVPLSGMGLLNATDTPVPETAVDVVGNDANVTFNRQFSDFDIHVLGGYATGTGPFKMQGASNNTMLRPQSVASVGAQRTWNHQRPDGAAIVCTATLCQQAVVTDERIVSLWAEDTEYGSGKINGGIISTLIIKFASGIQSVYTLAVSLVGQSWDGYSSSASLIDPNQTLDVVVLNIQSDGQAYGHMGYFWARNNFATSSQLLSNQPLSLYVNSEIIHLGGNDGLNTVISALSREFTHMADLYQRGALYGPRYMYDTQLEEMTAMAMEDVLFSQTDPGFNNVHDSRFPVWLQSALDCSLATFDPSLSSSCPGYPISGSLGGFLLRQYDIPYYTNLLQNFSSVDSTSVLNNTTQAGGGAGLGDAMGRWGAAVVLLPVPGSPSGFAYPVHTGSGFPTPVLNDPSYGSQHFMPTSMPATLQGFGQFPMVCGVKTDTHSETITVPVYSTVSIIIH